jgi:hypothetical protein
MQNTPASAANQLSVELVLVHSNWWTGTERENVQKLRGSDWSSYMRALKLSNTNQPNLILYYTNCMRTRERERTVSDVAYSFSTSTISYIYNYIYISSTKERNIGYSVGSSDMHKQHILLTYPQSTYRSLNTKLA